MLDDLLEALIPICFIDLSSYSYRFVYNSISGLGK